jgi:hypothetical protein
MHSLMTLKPLSESCMILRTKDFIMPFIMGYIVKVISDWPTSFIF